MSAMQVIFEHKTLLYSLDSQYMCTYGEGFKKDYNN